MFYNTFVCINTKPNYLKITSRLKSSANIYIPSDLKQIHNGEKKELTYFLGFQNPQLLEGGGGLARNIGVNMNEVFWIT